MARDRQDMALWMARLLAANPGTRDSLLDELQRCRAAGDVPGAGEVATLLLLHTLADFCDFRGLPAALAAFEAAAPAGLHADAVRLGRPSLDHRHAFGDPALQPTRARVEAALAPGSGLAPDERLLLAKVLVDFDGMSDAAPAATERLLARMQDMLPRASPRWQAAWWRLRAQCLDYAGQIEAAQQALVQLQQLAVRAGDPELDFALAGEQLRLALHVDDRARADRAFRTLEQLRPRVPPALLPQGLRLQAALLLRRGEHRAALERVQLILDLCEDHAVPERDRAGYIEQQAHALTGLGRHTEALDRLASLRATQTGGQAALLEVIIAMARAVQALDSSPPEAQAIVLAAIRQAAALGFHRFLMSFPARAAQVAAIGLEAGVEVEFLTRAVRERRLQPPDPGRADWPWALQLRLLGGLGVWRNGVPLGDTGVKAPRKPQELLTLLAAYPDGLPATAVVDALWPSLEAQAPKASLEMTVSRLRKWLDCHDAVRVADGRVSLDPALVWTDVGALEIACAAGDTVRALSLYRGPLLQGERLDGAMAAARERMAAVLSDCVLQAGTARVAAGARAQALALYALALAREPRSTALRMAVAELEGRPLP
jgi:tetratricopeptide (TPR) repeat protein